MPLCFFVAGSSPLGYAWNPQCLLSRPSGINCRTCLCAATLTTWWIISPFRRIDSYLLCRITLSTSTAVTWHHFGLLPHLIILIHQPLCINSWRIVVTSSCMIFGSLCCCWLCLAVPTTAKFSLDGITITTKQNGTKFWVSLDKVKLAYMLCKGN